jgi:molybdopterin-binding protein
MDMEQRLGETKTASSEAPLLGVRVGENLIERVITKQSVEDLNIKVGSDVTAIIKSTGVMLMVD